ncbi:ABC transporter substrate-binding protein [Yinghuangia sp. ASG 101]|uniref:ABC transporter substrate-binding protein n=1 Tax=Yinghuangia sp. ASG 101 TaxID=2896848 RepID=UPI001E35D362|nr:ABC transporter substrate-binding protein [Yinghuangia sp. ASG 101]UGQ11835.1 ABC transporter substrate-binding protein [Yinghuangia sp. ASG 101]
MSFSRRRRLSAAIATAVLATATAAACGSGGGSNGGGGGSGPTRITLGVIPIIDIAPVHLGIEKGFFAEQNLDVKTQNSQGGAAIVPGVVSGDFQFGYSNLVSLFIAKDKDVPVRMVSVGARASDNELDDGAGQLMAKDANLKTVADLKGKKVAVNTLKGINDVAIKSTLKKNGVPDDVTLVEVPIPNMPAALDAGQVDAVMISEPFTSAVEAQGGHALPVSYASMGHNLPFSAWFTSEAYAKKNPDVVQRFTAALEKSLRYADAHPDEARATLNSYLQLNAGVSDTVTLPGWEPTTNRDEVASLAQLTVDAGLIDNLKPVDRLLND